MIRRVDRVSPPERDSRRRRFRISVIAVSVVAAVVGSALLVIRDSGEKTTTLGVAATLPVPGHPEAVIAGPHALWVALQKPSGDQALLHLDLATEAVMRTVYLGGEVADLAHAGDRLIATVRRVGSGRGGQLAVLDWRSGVVEDRHWYARPFDRIVVHGNELWGLEARPGTLVRLDAETLFPTSAPLRLSPGRTPALASGGGYLWVTAADMGEVLRIDPETRAIKRVHVGGVPMGIVAASGRVWFADQERGKVFRLDPRSLRQAGEPIRVGARPSWLGVAAGSLFVADSDDGTLTRIDLHSGQRVGLPIRIAPPARGALAPSVAPARRSVWVSSFASNALIRVNSTSALGRAGGKVTVRITGTNDTDPPVTDGSLQGTGRFTASGAISAQGKVDGYRTMKGAVITLRFVTSDERGTITFVVKIDTDLVPVVARWTITSGTKAYKGLHGEGKESESPHFTVSTLSGTVSR